MKHLERDLDKLRREILDVGNLVEDAFERSVRSYLERDMVLARDVIQGDKEIDSREVDVEEECLKVLALHQPVAADLRYVITALKVNNDLERIGDLAANIAERAIALAGQPNLKASTALLRMSRIASEMVADSLKALIETDTDLAQRVLAMDTDLDNLHRSNMADLLSMMVADPDTVERASQHLSVSRYLERIGDYATNIAEDVIFLVDGEVVRHGLGGTA